MTTNTCTNMTALRDNTITWFKTVKNNNSIITTLVLKFIYQINNYVICNLKCHLLK